MKEQFLHYLWRMKQFDMQDLRTTTGETIHIQHIGEYNRHAGPDFLNSRIYIGETLWAGQVEIHIKSSEWKQHSHHEDPAYQNVILHVVYEDDEPILRSNGQIIPCLELKKRIPAGLLSNYQKLMHNAHWIPCQHRFHSVGQIIKNLWLDRMLIERLEQKTQDIKRLLLHNNNNWEECLYQLMARSFGNNINAEPFERLARQTPYTLIAKHKDNLLQIEALLFGQAGFLEQDFEERYPQLLKAEYHFLKKKYQLQALPKSNWHFLRTRPANFPSIRIAQLAGLLFRTEHLFSKLLAIESIAEIENMFALKMSPFWKDHYQLHKSSKPRSKQLGKTAIHLIIINTIAPFLFLYGQHRNDEHYKEIALRLLEELPPESNRIIRQWIALGIEPQSAYQTQALLQLKNEYCKKQQCLSCAIGNQILTTGTHLEKAS